MYLAQNGQPDGTVEYCIRHSYRDPQGNWRSRQLFDLGKDPGQYIVYVGGRGYYFDSAVEEAVSAEAEANPQEELEEIFWPFLDPDIKRVAREFRVRERGRIERWRGLGSGEIAGMQEGIHPFDRRRLCFLKFGEINMENTVDRPLAFFNLLLEKSRDEIEQRLEFMEAAVRPWERKGYLYAAFDLPRRFAPRLTRFIPDAQDPELVDGYFLEEICRLSQDGRYLDRGALPRPSGRLHPYLLKYLFQFFDMPFLSRSGGRRHGPRASGPQAWQPPAATPEGDHYRVLGISREEFARMDAGELTRLFRRKAKEQHPDQGGDHEAFIRLQQAYGVLIRRKAR